MCVKSLQTCLNLCDPMDCNLPGSSVHGILQARILEWVAISSSMFHLYPSYFPHKNPRHPIISYVHISAASLKQSLLNNRTTIPWASPGGASGEEPSCQCRRHQRHRFNPWAGKIPWRRKWQLTPVLLPGESHGQRSLAGGRPWGQTGLKQLSTRVPPYHDHT